MRRLLLALAILSPLLFAAAAAALQIGDDAPRPDAHGLPAFADELRWDGVVIHFDRRTRIPRRLESD